MAGHKARWLELTLDAAKAALTALEGETATAQATIADAQASIMGEDFPHLGIFMDVHGL